MQEYIDDDRVLSGDLYDELNDAGLSSVPLVLEIDLTGYDEDR
jgi:hypothetical protein